MKSLSFYFYVCAGLLVITIAKGNAKDGISCYECNSSNKACAESLDKSKIKPIDCSKSLIARTGIEPTACLKSQTEVNGVTGIVRSCGVSHGKIGCEETKLGGVTGTTCSCESDECNSAPKQIRSGLGIASQIGLHVSVLIVSGWLMMF